MSKIDCNSVAIIGGGPAGATTALCLRHLGREVVLFEKEKFPRYRIGESLLPGTLSILARLGVLDGIKSANFTVKRAATFLWGNAGEPWSFGFSTPKTSPWVFDHALHVTRSEYDKILLDAARERGATIKELCEVTNASVEERENCVKLQWKSPDEIGTTSARFVVDASGSRGVLAQKLAIRQWDKYYRNIALWSYWKGGKRFGGQLQGNILTVAFQGGWFWLIPLKENIYSVGVVVGIEENNRIRKLGTAGFYNQCLKSCPLVGETLKSARQCDKVRLLRDWSYESSKFSEGRAFFCGDSACFVDPLFSQGVHLATYSGMLTASAIDHLYNYPSDAYEVHRWYEDSYREAYHRYHKFVAAFYSMHQEFDSRFWSDRGFSDSAAGDHRLKDKGWQFDSEAAFAIPPNRLSDLSKGATTLAYLWSHGTQELTENCDPAQSDARRLLWANGLLKELKSLRKICWNGNQVRLLPSFKVHPTTFKLEPCKLLGNENGLRLRAYPLTEDHRQIFESLIVEPLSYAQLLNRLSRFEAAATPQQLVNRMFEDSLLQGFDGMNRRVNVRSALRFGGVGSQDDLS